MALQAANLYALVSVAGADKSISDLRRVSGQVNTTQGVMSGLAKNAGQMGRGVGQLAGGITRIAQIAAAATIGAGVAAAKTSIDFEESFASVRKSVGDTPAALDKIEEALEQLSTQIPVTFRDLSTIATEAGALGVATKDIESFTEAVARTSAATVGLDPTMAAEAFGKLSTIFSLTGARLDKTTGEMVSDYDRLGSALIALGNAGASSEPDIIDTSKFLAGSGQAAGLSAAQVLAWGSAVSSLGMEPEGGGGALSRVFQKVTTGIGSGTKAIKEWAKVSGVSVKEFADLYRKDAGGAVIGFLTNLGKMDKFAAAASLKKAGIVNQRDIRAVYLLSQNIDVLNNQLGISEEAWAENTELMEVSERRFDTLRSKLTMLHNTVLLGADAVGDGMTPAIGRLADKAKEFLTLHMDDLTNVGKDIGAAIDDIDWGKVNQGLAVAVDLGKALLGFIAAIPIEITAGVAAFSVLNRMSGGLLGAGAGNIIGGAVGMIGTIARGALLSALPASLRGPLGAATALHVWVDNMPGAGFGAGGAVVGGSRSVLGTIGSIAAKVFIVGAAVGVFSELLGALNRQSDANRDHAASLDSTMTEFIAHGNVAAMEQSLRNLEALNREMNDGLSPEKLAYQLDIDGLRTTVERQMTALRNAIDRYERGNRGAFGPPAPGGGGGRFGGSGGLSLEDRDAAFGGRRGAGLTGWTLSATQIGQILHGGAMPTGTPEQLQGILERAIEKGFHPKGGVGGAAVQATYQRDMIRQAQDQAAKLDALKSQEAATTAAVNAGTMALHSLGQKQGMTALINIVVPAARSYQQTINETRHYGPSIPNAPRHAPGTGPLP